MKVFLDDQEVHAGDESLAGALDACRKEAESLGRLIIEVWADGERTSDGDLENPPPFTPYADEIRMVSVEPAALVGETLLELADAMPGLIEQQQSIAEALQIGETSEAMASLSDALNLWDGVRRAVVEGASLVCGDPTELLASDARESFASSTESLASALTALRDMIRMEDLSGAADILEGELVDEANAWRGILGALADGAMQRGKSA
jgi:hypothetical protein